MHTSISRRLFLGGAMLFIIGFAIDHMQQPTTITVEQGNVPTIAVSTPTLTERPQPEPATPTLPSTTNTQTDIAVPTSQNLSSIMTSLTAVQCLDEESFEWKPCVNLQTDGENLSFLPASARIPANQTALMVFQNTSSAQSHNVLLIRGGDDVAAQIDWAANADDAQQYIPASTDNVLAYTTLIPPGARTTVEIPPLPTGTYTFICTYPGHFGGGMKGVLVVE